MLRDILTSRTILIGLFFFIVIVSSSLIYSWHVQRTTEAELQQTIQAIKALKNKNKIHIPEEPNAPTTHAVHGELVDTPEQNTDTLTSTENKTLRVEATDILDMADALLPDDKVLRAQQVSPDVSVSPYGFGPYPELPEGWAADTFPSPSADHELLARVRIKLFYAGINTRGANMENGLVYPVIPGIAYVKWKEYERSDGIVRYISDMIAHPSDGLRIAAIRAEKGRVFTEADIPSDIKLMSFEEGAIDPYTFLDLPLQ
ncbi:hypothetical protein F4054_12960 [Candidatus Poribacteria bacterium]|nr:hypothetical protein [Candidatus Poribacteria bacterium]MYG06207.1 hypothetical protein [Candidatus Poribacteria bacterium]MYK23153.1 hypothetical protein [Candidatus Poribacteria bacterium]